MPRTPKSDDSLDDDLEPTGSAAEEADLGDFDVAADEDDEDGDLIDVPASAEGRASALRLIEFLVEKKALAMHAKKPGKALLEKIAQILESPAPLKSRASRLSEEIVDSDDVDDLFIDDETLIQLLKRW